MLEGISGKRNDRLVPVLLVSSSIEDASRSPIIQNNSHYPLGIGYLHSFLERHGCRVETLFLNDYPFYECLSEVLRAMTRFSPEFVGFNILTQNRTSSFGLIEYIHQHYDVTILTGGIHSTVMYDQILRKYPYVVAVLGEGEETTKELIEAASRGEPLRTVKGIAFVENGEVIKTPSRELIEDLDSLPFPKHEVFFTMDRTVGNLLTSRGCPFKCSFCVLDMISHQRVRYRTVKNVVDEIEYLSVNFPRLQTIWIHDDNFLLNNRRAIEICNEIVNRGIRIRFICSARFNPFSRELADALERAGFVQILFGLESGAEKILESCHKKIRKHDVIDTLKILKKSRIEVTAFLIVGLYGENEKTVQETISFVKQMQKVKYIYYDDIGVLMIYPGTEIYEIAKRHGLVEDSFWLTEGETPYFILEHTHQKLLDYKERIRDAISLCRFFSASGFMKQFDMLPHILRYALSGSHLSKGNVKSAVLQGLPRYVGSGIKYLLAKLPSGFKAFFKSEK